MLRGAPGLVHRGSLDPRPSSRRCPRLPAAGPPP